MRKFLVLVAIVGLATLVAVPAYALDFKFGAEYRVRFYSNLNGSQANLGRDDGAFSARGVQTRIRPQFDVSDDNGNMTATLRLEIGDIEWGNGGGPSGAANGVAIPPSGNRTGPGAGGALGNDGVNVETKWAYVDFAMPWGVPLRWRAGLQGWYESKGIIVDDDAAGLRGYGKAGILNYEIGWYRVSGGPCASTTSNVCSTSNALDNNYDFYEGKVGFAVAKWLNPTVYYMYGRNAATNTAGVSDPTKPQDVHFFGAAVNGDAGFLRYDLDFVFGRASGGPNGNFASAGDRVKTKGWVIDGGVHFPIGPALIHVVGSYATGDKQDGGDSEAMPYIGPSWNGAGGLYEIIGAGGAFDQVDVTQDYPGGLWMLGAGVEYRPVKALWLRAMYGYAGFTDKRANCAFSFSRTAGRCMGPVYQGDGFVAPTVDATGTVVAGGQGGIAGESSLGQEISFRADYDLWTNFKVQGAAGWLIPSEGSTVHEYVLQLLYKF